MITTKILLITAAEIALLLLVVCIFLIIQNRSLKNLVKELKAKAKGVISELKKTKKALAESTQSESVVSDEGSGLSYLDYIEQELTNTLNHHDSLNSNQPIALDIEPGTPLPHRAAALRHAMMLAEKDAFGKKDELDWKVLRTRYDQIFSFYEDFQDDNGSDENYDELHTELQNAKKRISNLEKFKKLYFDLEDQWNNSKTDAQHAFNNLTTIASEIDESGRLGEALDDYQSSYNGLSQLFDSSSGSNALEVGATEGIGVSEEVKHLRTVAADQHRIIEGLQKQLMSASSSEERESVVEGLQNELQKQARFIQESETCIQLLEDELSSAAHELDQLKAKSNMVPELKTELVNLRKQSDELELKYHTTLSENRKLQKQIKELASNSKGRSTGDDSTKLKKELSELVERYNDLEERFLDLKMQQ